MMLQKSNNLYQNDINSEHTNHDNIFINFLNNKYKDSSEPNKQTKDSPTNFMIGSKTNKFEPYTLKSSSNSNVLNGAKFENMQNVSEENLKNSISNIFMTGNSQRQSSELQYSKLSTDLNQIVKGKGLSNNLKLNQFSNNNTNNFRTSNLRDSSKEFKISEINESNDNEMKLFSNVPSTLWDSLEDNYNLLMNKRSKPEVAVSKSKNVDNSCKLKENKNKLVVKSKNNSLANLKDHQAIPMNFQIKNKNFKLELNENNDILNEKFNIFNEVKDYKDFFQDDRRGSLNNLNSLMNKNNKKDSIDYFNNSTQQNYLKFPCKASFNNSELRDSILYQDQEKSEKTINNQENSKTDEKEDLDRVDGMKDCGLSREMKMLKNRISAKKCREKKKKEREIMEDENDKLKKEVESLKNEIAFYNLTSKMKTVSI